MSFDMRLTLAVLHSTKHRAQVFRQGERQQLILLLLLPVVVVRVAESDRAQLVQVFRQGGSSSQFSFVYSLW